MTSSPGGRGPCVPGWERKRLTSPSNLVTGVRPAAWLDDGWLEGTLDGRTGLFHVKDVEYL